MADLATLGIRVDASGAITVLDQFGKAVGKTEKQTSALMGTIGKLGAYFSAGLIARAFIDNTIEAQNAMAQLEARVKSTGGAAGLSVKQLDELSSAIERQTVFSDEAVKGAESLLLTFTKIKGDTMKDATLAVANLATVMGTDMKGAAIQLGKALQDPATGLLALRRSGVSFSEAQQDVIKNLFATGREAEAQRMILAELEVEFGGAAAAARDTLGGALKGLQNAFGNVWEVSRDSSGGIVAAINGIAAALPALRDGIGAAFGGLELMWVDLQVGIQRFNAFVYEGMADLLDIFAKVMGYLPGTADEVRDVSAAAASLHGEAATLTDAYAAWQKEQEALIVGTKEHTAAAQALATTTQEVKRTAYEMGLEDARAAKAKKLLTDEIDRQLEREDRLAAMRKGYIKPSVGGFTNQPFAGPLSPGYQGGAGSGLGQMAIDAVNVAAVYKSVYREVTKAATVSATEREQIEQNFLRGMQEGFAKTFQDIFTKGIKSFGDLFRGMRDLFLQAAAQILSSSLMEKIKGRLSPSTENSTSGGAGALSGLSAGAVGMLAGAFMVVSNGLKNMADANRAMAEEYRRNISAGQSAQQRLDAMFAGTSAQGTIEANRKQALGDARQTWAINGGGPMLDDLMARVNAFFDAQVAALKVETAYQKERTSESLRERMLRAQGDTDAADALALWNQQVDEMRKAVLAGWDVDALAQLSAVQEAERNRLLQTQEQTKAAAAAAKAEQALADAREKAARQMSALQDLTVELLAAQGKTAESDQLAFDLEQQRRLELAQKDQTAEYVAKLKELQALQRAARDAAISGAGASAGAGAGAVEASTASNAYAGAGTVTSTFGTRVSGEVGDRMLDNLVSIRVILRTIESNTRNLGGRLNTSLGLSLADNYALNGSAVLS